MICKLAAALISFALASPWTAVQTVDTMVDTMDDTTDDQYSVKLPREDQISPYVRFVVELIPGDAKPDEVVILRVKTDVVEGWHIYSLASLDGGIDNPVGYPTKISLETIGLTSVDDDFKSSQEPQEIGAAAGEVQRIHRGQFEWTRRYRIDQPGNGFSVKGTVTFQACDDTRCVPPRSLDFKLGQEKNTSQSRHGLNGKVDQGTADSIVIAMEPCKAKRPSVVRSVSGLMAGIFFGRGEPEDKLVSKGSIAVEGQNVDIYLPESETYTTVNPQPDNSQFSNRATYISVDQNRDGRLVEHESFASNLPVRILDSMFEVSEIDPQGKSITLRPIDVPLFGVVIGRRCPEFWYETVDGEIVSNTSILGKAAILDVWAVT